MSAFVVHPEHINVLLWGALRAAKGRLCWFYGNPTRMGELTDTTATTIGQMLLDANVASVNYLYTVEQAVAVYRYAVPRRREWSTVEILKALACYQYQACEAPDWEGSYAQTLCRTMERELILELPGWSEGPWSISPTTEPAAFTAERRKSQAAAR